MYIKLETIEDVQYKTRYIRCSSIESIENTGEETCTIVLASGNEYEVEISSHVLTALIEQEESSIFLPFEN